MNLVEIWIFENGKNLPPRCHRHIAMCECLAQSCASPIVNLLLNSADRILRERLVSSFSFLTTASRCTLCICKWKTQNARSTQKVGRALVCQPDRGFDAILEYEEKSLALSFLGNCSSHICLVHSHAESLTFPDLTF